MTQIGLVGLGKMGGNMAERLRRAGHEVVGYDRDPKASDVGSLQELKDLMALVGRTKADRIPITTRPHAEANAALEDLRAGRVVGRSVLVP